MSQELPFSIGIEELGEIVNFDMRADPSLVEVLNSTYDGVAGVAARLNTSLTEGIVLRYPPHFRSSTARGFAKGPDMTTADWQERCDMYGENIIPPPRSETILEIVYGTVMEDPILKTLIAGAIIVLSLGTAICPSHGWIEGLAIVIAVFVVLSVTAGNDYSKDRKFKKLMLLQTDKRCRVIRSGFKNEISSWDLLVGDLVELVVGDEVPADGIFISGNRLVIDESPLTGETIPCKKEKSSPFLFSGCQVCEGTGYMIVTAVGVQSSGGKIQELLNDAQDQMTPLQNKLKDVAILIGQMGLFAGIITFLALAIQWGIAISHGVASASDNGCSSSGGTAVIDRVIAIVEDFVVSITVIVVAVPEGLPLAVTLALSISMFKMMRDNCFVRHLDASETMGQATTVCTDKTGTLTYNRMSAVKIMVSDRIYKGEGSGDKEALPFFNKTFGPEIVAIMTDGICINSTCFIKNEELLDEPGILPAFAGSATEGALLILARKLGINYKTCRQKLNVVDNGVWSFTAERKRMSTMITHGGDYRLFTKGASEIVLALCTHVLNDETGQPIPMSPNAMASISKYIHTWAGEGLRTFALAYKDSKVAFDSTTEGAEVETDLCFIALIGIKDPLRKEIPGAVTMCQRAGLIVRMVTGDNIATATKIARECNIFNENGVAIEGPDFRIMTEEAKLELIPRLQVMARCSPFDKFELVRLLKQQGEVVAVTGDGTNDAPALKEADIGFSMGISGTQIAMNASDIVLLDDNFASIVQATRWGRNVLSVIRKFLQFQLGINLVAVIVTFLGSVIYGASPLSTVQLLWINLIMDSFGAIALASDDPDARILEEPPQRRTDPLLTKRMKRYIAVQTIYQTVVLMVLLTSADKFWPIDTTGFHSSDNSSHGSPSIRTRTMLFNSFILMQLTNLMSARHLNGELNIFTGFFKNKYFLAVLFIIAGVQLFAVAVAYSLFNCAALSVQEWGICIMFSAINVPVVTIANFCFHLFDVIYKSKGNARRVHDTGKGSKLELGTSHSVIMVREDDVEDVESKENRKFHLPEVRGKESQSKFAATEAHRADSV